MKTTVEKQAVKILQTLVLYINGHWDIESLYSHLAFKPYEGLFWLQGQGFIYEMVGSFAPTESGKEYYQGICKNASFDMPTHRFKEEALSGITTKKSSKSSYIVSDKSEIRNAVLHGPAKRVYKDPDVMRTEESKIELKYRICRETGLTVTELREQQDRVKLCPRCGEFQLFHKNKRQHDGLHTYCKRCRRAK